MHVTVKDLTESWSFDDMMMAHEVLNALEDAEARIARQMRERNG